MTEQFQALSPAEKQTVIAFLKTLRAPAAVGADPVAQPGRPRDLRPSPSD